MDFDQLLVRFFGTDDIATLPPEQLVSGIERLRLQFGLERDSGRRFALWCLISYVPFLWHPLVLISDAGDKSVPGMHSYVSEGQLVDREVFAARNAELARAGARPARGERSNPIYLQPPHAVGRALYTAFTTAPE